METNLTSKSSLIIHFIIGKFASLYGLGFLMISLIIILDDSNDILSILFATLICGIIGICLIRFGIKRRKFIKRFRKYEDIISYRQEVFIDSIANMTSQSADFVIDDIQKMIKRKLFINMYIDRKYKRIIFKGKNDLVKTSYDGIDSVSRPKKMSVVKCSGCGAPNKISKGSSSECEFCGSPIVSNERY